MLDALVNVVGDIRASEDCMQAKTLRRRDIMVDVAFRANCGGEAKAWGTSRIFLSAVGDTVIQSGLRKYRRCPYRPPLLFTSFGSRFQQARASDSETLEREKFLQVRVYLAVLIQLVSRRCISLLNDAGGVVWMQ